MPQLPAERSLIRFAEKVLTLLEQGRVAATYKYAVLLGLIDLCMEHVSRGGQPPTSITTRQLTEKIIELYWPQTTRFEAVDNNGVLLQNQGQRQAKIVSAISQFREESSYGSLARLRAAPDNRFEVLIKKVELKLIEMPLPRLQFFGSREDRFIYEIPWTREETLKGNWSYLQKEIQEYQWGRPSTFDNAIRLKPSASHAMLALNSLLRPAIRAQWVAKVGQFNGLEQSRLDEFLFGTDRSATAPVREGLLEIQGGRCLFCRRMLREAAEVDHFIPWSRLPHDRLDNLVVAHAKCNRAKLDFLAANRHIDHWRQRNDNGGLQALADQQTWHRDKNATLRVARAVYFHLPDGSPLWVEGAHFKESRQASLRRLLS